MCCGLLFVQRILRGFTLLRSPTGTMNPSGDGGEGVMRRLRVAEIRWFGVVLALAWTSLAMAGEGDSRRDDHDPLRQPFFGDTHVHTTLSFDANSQDTRNTPRDAYRFARGARMGIQPYDADGNPTRWVQLARPLDFAAVTDHAEFLGEISLCTTPGTWSYWHPVCFAHRNWAEIGILAFGVRGLIGKGRWGFCGEDDSVCVQAAAETWT